MRRAPLSARKKAEYRQAYLMIAPVVLGIVVFFVIPTIWSIFLSFTEGPDYVTYKIVGFKNYITMLRPGSDMWQELLNTFYYAFASVALSMIVSVLLANALNQDIRMRSLFRVIYFLPSVTMAAAVGMVWRSLLNSQYGLVNQALKVVGITGPKWLTDPNFMMLGVIIVGVWSSAGYNMIILLAGLKNIPRVYYEAAQIDGANAAKQFTNVTVPLLSPVLFFVSITSLMGGFKAFDVIYTLAGSGATADKFMRYYRTMVYGIYEKGFLYHKLGIASAEAVILLIIILVLTMIQFRLQDKWVHYE
ncbi:MAG: sugar ABC transporter permease [Clostridiales bacterium]|nr:sugar ABC transporter permease [Clostridiales bacterium]